MKLFATAAASLLMAGSLQAATLDFVAEAAGNERGVVDGTTINFDGVDVSFSALNGFAYFDDVSGGPGGLGVCQTLDVNDQCDPSSDDNITITESVTLTLDGTYDFFGLSFNDAKHNSLDGNIVDTLLIGINGLVEVRYTFAEAVAALFENVNKIRFVYDTANEGTTANQFYVSGATVSAVPLPAAGWLLIGGLGGLAAMKRRKKAA